MAATVHVDTPAGVQQPYTYEAEAEAGINLGTGERWFGTRIRFRPGAAGRWHHVLAVDVHPMDTAAVEGALRAHLAQTLSRALA